MPGRISDPHYHAPSVVSTPLKSSPAAVEKQSHDKGLEILRKPAGAAKTPLADRKIDITPSPSLWQSIVRYFSRHFGAIPETNKQKAQEIRELISKIDAELDQINVAAQTAKRLNRKADGAFPSLETIQFEETFQEEAAPHLKEASSLLIQLQAMRNDALELAEAHARYDSLSQRIDSLGKELHAQAGRMTVGQKLLDLEKAMQAYFPDKKWAQFTDITDKRKALYNEIQSVIGTNPAFKEDTTLQGLTKASNFAATNSYDALQRMYPNLDSYVERLFDATVKVIEERYDALTQKIDEMIPLFAKHKKLSKQISELEFYIHDASLFARIYRFFHDIEALKAQLQEAKTELALVSAEIRSKGKFNHEEIQWVYEQGKSDEKFGVLGSEVSDIKKGVDYLDLREPISSELSQLIQKLSEYRGAKLSEDQAKQINSSKLPMILLRKSKRSFSPILVS